MQITEKIGKIFFTAKIDEEGILREIESIKKQWEPGRYTHYTRSTDYVTTEKEYMEDIEKMKAVVAKYCTKEMLLEVIDRMPKKKNGSFHLRRVRRLEHTLYISEFYQDYHYGWTTYALTAEVISDTMVRIVLRKDYDQE